MMAWFGRGVGRARRLAVVSALALGSTALAGVTGLRAAPYPMPVPELNSVDISGFYLPRVTAFGDSYSRLNRSSRDPATGRFQRVLN